MSACTNCGRERGRSGGIYPESAQVCFAHFGSDARLLDCERAKSAAIGAQVAALQERAQRLETALRATGYEVRDGIVCPLRAAERPLDLDAIEAGMNADFWPGFDDCRRLVAMARELADERAKSAALGAELAAMEQELIRASDHGSEEELARVAWQEKAEEAERRLDAVRALLNEHERELPGTHLTSQLRAALRGGK